MYKMKDKLIQLIKNSMCLTGVIVVWTNLAEAWIDPSWWSELCIIGSIAMFSFLVCAVFSWLEQYFTNNYLLEVVIEFIIVVVIYVIFGGLFEWYTLSTLWVMPVHIIPVFLIIYLFRLNRINRDIEFINQKINLQKQDSQ